MVLVQTTVPRDLRALLGPLLELAEGCVDLVSSMAGTFSARGRRYPIPRVLFSSPSGGEDRIRLGVFAGLHGDEPAGCEAVLRFAQELAANLDLSRGYDLVLYPLCNPTGYEDNRRENHAGLDLNREFWRSSLQPEVRILERELRLHRFQGIVTLHSDDTSDGIYGYSHGRIMNEVLLRPALHEASRILPLDTRGNIDGFVAQAGVICDCFQGILSAPPEQRPQPFDLIFETPARADHEQQVEASVEALHVILREYRPFIAYGQNL